MVNVRIMIDEIFPSVKANLEQQAMLMTAKPGATVTFHWPRFDLDQLLCVRLVPVMWACGESLW